MRQIIILLTIFSLLTACAAPTAPPPAAAVTNVATAAPEARSAIISELVGEVNGRARPDESLAPVNVGFQLKIGGEVKTGAESRARLDFSDQSILRLSANSSYTLQAVRTADDGSVLARIKLTAGRIWVSLFGGELEVETPLGVASVRGSFAVFSYDPGDPNDPNDDVLVVDCIEGDCGARSPSVNEQLGNMERLVLGNQNTLRLTLTGQDVQDFLDANPESQRMVATLTAAPPVNTQTPTAQPSNTFTPVATATPTNAPIITTAPVVLPTFTPVPPTVANNPPTSNAPSLGTHVVRAGETLFCIGRGYGVLPTAIATANGLAANAALRAGTALNIPSVRWPTIPAGPACSVQFSSPFAPTATPTPTTAPGSAATATPQGVTCGPNEFFDPVMNQCRPNNPPTTAAPSVTLTPVGDTTGPSITSLSASPNPAGPISNASCTVTFRAIVTDPSGVSLVDLEWQAFDSAVPTSAPPTGLTVVTMALSPRSPNLWEATVAFSLPMFTAQTQWTVSALDGAGNSSTVGGPNVDVGGCIN